MSLSNRQKNIVNPFAQVTNSDTRNGEGYDYSLLRNRFVLDAIHEQYINFYSFPVIGTILRGVGYELTEEDMLAYFALYPQNGELVEGESRLLTDDEAITVLSTITQLLEESDVLQKYTSKTSMESFEEFYQEESLQKVANLISIPPFHSKAYQDKLRHSLNLPAVQYNENVGLDQLSVEPEVAIYMSTDSSVDLYDWTQNGLPGEDNDRVYYNPIDSHYYYVRRTNDVSRGGFSLATILRNTAKTQNIQAAVNYWNNSPQDLKDSYLEALDNGIREILKLSQKNSEENFTNLKTLLSPPTSYEGIDLEQQSDEVFPLLSYKGTRPGSRWIYALKIDSAAVASLETNDDDQRPSQNEYQLAPLEKAKRIIGTTNLSSTSVTFQVLEIIRNLLPVRTALRSNFELLTNQGLTPEVLEGIDLDREAVRLESFVELMEIFYNHNRISIDESDRVQIFFRRNYTIDHFIINGNFYYHGCGENNYFDTSSEAVSIVNAFSLFTSTTFSILKSSQEIYERTSVSSIAQDPDPINFLNSYVYPKVDLNALKVKRRNRQASSTKQRKRRETLFTKLSNLASTSPAEFERLYDQRDRKFRIGAAIKNMDCNTGQARAAKYALKFYQALQGKTKVKSLIRETILVLRQEVVQDELAKRILSEGQAYNENPDLFIRDAEKFINDQIFCSLDVLGDFIEDRFLDPAGLPPAANALSRKSLSMVPTVELKKQKMISLKVKQSEIYRKAVKVIIENFIKSIVAGVIKDIVNALFGCGPAARDRDSNMGLRNISSRTNYGGIDLVAATSTLDLVEIAKQTPLFNVTTENVDDRSVEIYTSATNEQLVFLLNDISAMCTPVEAQQLLDGEADYDLVEHILETVSGNILIPSAEIDPTNYNTIEFSNQNIVDFFILLGDNLDFENDDVIQNSPLAAFCENKNLLINNEISPDDFQFSLEDQYVQIVNAKLDKINFLCDFLRGLEGLDLRLQRLFSLLPEMTWYNDLLIFIAQISNELTDQISSFFRDLFDQEETRYTREKGEYNIYNSRMGTELFYQMFFPMRELTINQVFVEDRDTGFLTPAGWNPSRVGFSIRTALNGDVEWRPGGNFGGRRNDQTPANVFSKIWSDTRANVDIYREWQADPNRDPGDRPPEGAFPRLREIPRLGLPQFIEHPQKQYDVWDTAYYATRTAPDSLLPSINSLLTRQNLSLLGSVNDEGSRTQEERNFLSILGNRVEDYFKKRESTAPFIGWTGATYLKYTTPDVTISFFAPVLRRSLRRQGQRYTQNIVASFSPGTRNSLDADGAINYNIFNGVQVGNNTVRLNNQPGNQYLIVNNIVMPPVSSPGYKKMYGDLSIGEHNNREAGNFTMCLQNYSRRIDEQINDSIVAGPGPERMSQYIKALNLSPFVNSGDECITPEDVTKANSGIRAIQTRMFMFFLNINPLTTTYNRWGSQGTINLVTDYLHRKISEELEDADILGALYTTFDSIAKVYGRNEDVDKLRLNPEILSSNTPSQNLYNIIEAMYVGMINNLANTNSFKDFNLSAFTEEYNQMLLLVYRHLSEDRTDLSEFQINPNRAPGVKEQIRQFYDDDGITELGMLVSPYFLPIAFQIASYFIYMDKGIKYSERYSATFLKSISMTAAADDALLSAVKGQSIYRGSKLLRKFPATIRTFETNIDITYFRPREVRQRIEQLELYLGNFEDTVNEFFGIYDIDRIFEIQSSQEADITDTSLWENYLTLPRSSAERRQISSRRREIIPEINRIFNEWIGPDAPLPPELEPADQVRLLQMTAEVTQLRLRLAALPPFGNERERQRLVQEINTLEQQIEAIEAVGRRLVPFNYNRTLENAIQQSQNQNISEIVRAANEFWKIILENEYKSIDIDVLTPESYYDAVGNYFRVWGEITQARYETERGDRRGIEIPREVEAIKYAADFITYIGNTYDNGINIGPKLLLEKTKLENLINTNE